MGVRVPPLAPASERFRERTGYHEEIAILNRGDSFAAGKLHLLGSKFRVLPLLPNASSRGAGLQAICKPRELSDVSIQVDAASAGFPAMES